jgi:hypothetical protein
MEKIFIKEAIMRKIVFYPVTIFVSFLIIYIFLAQMHAWAGTLLYHWIPNEDPDLDGYRAYYCNGATAQQLSDGEALGKLPAFIHKEACDAHKIQIGADYPATATSLAEPIMCNETDKSICFVAFDTSGNESVCSMGAPYQLPPCPPNGGFFIISLP